MSALDDIRQRAEAATAGPWRTEAVTEGRFAGVESRVYSTRASHILLSETDGQAGHATNHDAEFIAHARTDIPRLLGALDAVLAEADDWEKRFQTTNTFDVAIRGAAHKIRAAVNNALEGGTMSNWPPPLASRAIRRHCPHQQVKGGYCAECGTQLNDALEGK